MSTDFRQLMRVKDGEKKRENILNVVPVGFVWDQADVVTPTAPQRGAAVVSWSQECIRDILYSTALLAELRWRPVRRWCDIIIIFINATAGARGLSIQNKISSSNTVQRSLAVLRSIALIVKHNESLNYANPCLQSTRHENKSNTHSANRWDFLWGQRKNKHKQKGRSFAAFQIFVCAVLIKKI